MKHCQTCGVLQPLENYYQDKRKRDGHEARCRTCCSRRSLAGKRLRRWGVDQEEYDDRMRAQGGACAICLGASGATRQLAVDHSHATGRVRELLCGKCNTALGQLDEDMERMERLIDYLKKWAE
jgi:hypothetical protein